MTRRALFTETALVLGVSLGASAIWSMLRIIERATRAEPIAAQTTRMNTAVTPDRPWLDLTYQLVGIGIAVIPALLAVHLLTRDGSTSVRRLGLDASSPWRDLGRGALLAAVVGIPGLGLYAVARALGVNTTIAAANLTDVWWAVPVLVLAAVQNAVLEEVVMIGYLFTRWTQAGWGWWRVVLVSAVVRGSYHLYQGLGGFVGNLAMGVIFALAYRRWGRVMPLVVAHTLLDIVAFVGYALLKDSVPWLG